MLPALWTSLDLFITLLIWINIQNLLKIFSELNMKINKVELYLVNLQPDSGISGKEAKITFLEQLSAMARGYLLCRPYSALKQKFLRQL